MTYDVDYIQDLVAKLNKYRHEYYNLNAPSVPDSVYDHLFDELIRLEQETGIVLSNSPTQTVGYKAVSELNKVQHPIPLLSLDKTKAISDLITFVKEKAAILMLKLDGLTVKLVYENGQLIEASTRGNGEEGEIITHNIPAFENVPLTIPYKNHLVITGEAFIHKNTFEELKDTLVSSNGEKYHNARNLAAGSVRCLDANTCKERKVHFYAFNVLEVIDVTDDFNDRAENLLGLKSIGFDICPFILLKPNTSEQEIEQNIEQLKAHADGKDIPIDGMVLRYCDMEYSRSLGRTGHHYKDGIAFKFEDETYETIFRSIEWQPGRTGEIAPVAVFDTVEIDGCDVSRATLHNLSNIKSLELHSGCRILVSKRNMIIPHIEENMDRGQFDCSLIPDVCPCCGKPTRIYSRTADGNRIVETLHCDNLDCSDRILQSFVHFVEKKAMNIKGLSEATLQKFIELGYLKTYNDLYHLDQYRDEIIALEGFGEKSYEKLVSSINDSRNTTFARYLVAMDIPMVGKTASTALENYFKGNLREFELAAMERFDFTCLPDFGATLRDNIHEWFHNSDHIILWRTLQKEMKFKERKEEHIMSENTNNIFKGCTIVVTGTLQHFTRDGINSKIVTLGAKAGSSVSKKTDYLICGEKAGSKLAKAKELGVKVLSEQEFLDMIA